MSGRCKAVSYQDLSPEDASKRMNIDVLALKLKEVDLADYDHPHLDKVFGYLSKLCKKDQVSVIKSAIGHEYTFGELVQHVMSLFVIQEQSDEEGKFCAMGFGSECVSVATWDGLDIPDHAEQVDVTKVCYKGKDGQLRCGGQLSFLEFVMDHYEMSFQELCACIKRRK